MKEADKGSDVVLMTKNFFVTCAHKLFENECYKRILQHIKETALKQLRAARKKVIVEFGLTLLKAVKSIFSKVLTEH